MVTNVFTGLYYPYNVIETKITINSRIFKLLKSKGTSTIPKFRV